VWLARRLWQEQALLFRPSAHQGPEPQVRQEQPPQLEWTELIPLVRVLEPLSLLLVSGQRKQWR